MMRQGRGSGLLHVVVVVVSLYHNLRNETKFFHHLRDNSPKTRGNKILRIDPPFLDDKMSLFFLSDVFFKANSFINTLYFLSL